MTLTCCRVPCWARITIGVAGLTGAVEVGVMATDAAGAGVATDAAGGEGAPTGVLLAAHPARVNPAATTAAVTPHPRRIPAMPFWLRAACGGVLTGGFIGCGW